MAGSDAFPPGAPCWIDLMTTDAERVRDFYAQVFGWQPQEGSPDFGGYFMFLRDGVPVAGGMPSGPDMGPGNIWSVYLAVDDARKTIDAAVANGGQTIVDAMPIADLGIMGVVSDPNGAVIGLWQPNAFSGFGVQGQTGAPVWFELHTTGYDQAVAFYRTVFGWDTHVMSDTPEFRYTTLGEGDAARAGIMDAASVLPEGAPPCWGIYFGVEDTDAALEKITSLGGSIVEPAMDTPYGRLAVATDPAGAQFRIMGPNKQTSANG